MTSVFKELEATLRRFQPELRDPIVAAMSIGLTAYLESTSGAVSANEPLYVDFARGHVRRGSNKITRINVEAIPWRLLARYHETPELHFLSIRECGAKRTQNLRHQFISNLGTLTNILARYGVHVEHRSAGTPGYYLLELASQTPSGLVLTSNKIDATEIASCADKKAILRTPQARKVFCDELRRAYEIDPGSAAVSEVVAADPIYIGKFGRDLLPRAWGILIDRFRSGTAELRLARQCEPDPSDHSKVWEYVDGYFSDTEDRLRRLKGLTVRLEAFCRRRALIDEDVLQISDALDHVVKIAEDMAVEHGTTDDQAIRRLLDSDLMRGLIDEAALDEDDRHPEHLDFEKRKKFAAESVVKLAQRGEFIASSLLLSASEMRRQLILKIRREARSLWSRQPKQTTDQRPRPSLHQVDLRRADKSDAASRHHGAIGGKRSATLDSSCASSSDAAVMTGAGNSPEVFETQHPENSDPLGQSASMEDTNDFEHQQDMASGGDGS